MLPDAAAPVVVSATLDGAHAILAHSCIGVSGFGPAVSPPSSTGDMTERYWA
jgi:hypothetical protein